MSTNLQVMDYDYALSHQIWKTERNLADRIMSYVTKMNLNYKLDKLTRGLGNCFPLAVLQQLSHQEIFDLLIPEMKTIVRNLDHQELRKKVRDFILTSNDERLTPLRTNFDEGMNALANSGETTETWQHYWEKMMKDNEWVDSFFVQATAFLLNLNIKIIETSGNERNPFHEIKSGRPNSKTIHIGYVTATHYQSLIVKDSETQMIIVPTENQDIKDQSQCPVCKKWFKNALNHIVKNIKCSGQITETEKMKLHNSANERKRIQNAKRQAKDRAKKKAIDPEKFKEDHNLWNEKWLSLKRAQDPKKVKADQNQRQSKCRKIETEEDRLREFRNATMFSAIFLCISCQTRQFFSNIQEFTSTIEEDLKRIWKPTPIQDIIYDLNLRTRVIINQEIDVEQDEKSLGKKYICRTCLTKLKRKTLPGTSVMNNLQLHDTDEVLKGENILLTELEGSLIAKLIIFQKIFLLPRSRWTALKDRTINVPIQDETINNFVRQLPRLPNEAGLIALELKRKIEMKNTHKKQLINPSKIFKCLAKLKAKGNPHYTKIDSPEEFKKRCKEKDKIGHDLIFGDDDDLEEVLKSMNSEFNENPSDEVSELQKIQDNETNDDGHLDPTRKFNFKYDQTVCMADKYPEISVAPGEGQTPTGILSEKDWDIKAFPHLHNADGTNGKDQDRPVKLTDQYYFIQRVINKETRFSSNPDYLYSAVAYLEQKQIYANINNVGRRGKQVTSNEGQLSYELQDVFRVLENMKNTPKYWKKLKYEILAKIDNLGPFQLFFTLSCADQRWSANFAEILLRKGHAVSFTRNNIESSQEPFINVRCPDGTWKPIMQFIKEDIEESSHELIRGNVVAATRYFHNRVTCFINKILLQKSNPMSVQFYSYKVEFQERGAPHIHGVLWLNIAELENLSRINGKFSKTQTGNDKPLKGILKTFTKLRISDKLDNEDCQRLISFIDGFITVSTHGKTF